MSMTPPCGDNRDFWLGKTWWETTQTHHTIHQQHTVLRKASCHIFNWRKKYFFDKCTNSVVQYHPENCSTVVFFLLSCHRFSKCFSILKLLCQGPNFAACHISVFKRQQKIKGEPPPFSPIQHPIRTDEFESNKKIFMSAGPYLCEEGQWTKWEIRERWGGGRRQREESGADTRGDLWLLV